MEFPGALVEEGVEPVRIVPVVAVEAPVMEVMVQIMVEGLVVQVASGQQAVQLLLVRVEVVS